MPVTPLHIGLPGLLAHRWPGRVDLFAAALGSVLIDLEFFAYVAWGSPIHGHLHTIAGATAMALVIIGVAWLLRKPVARLKEFFCWEPEANLRSITLGAFLGTFSHILYDSLIYSEMNPFHPKDGNPLYLSSDLAAPRIYLIAGVTTLIFLALYILKFNRVYQEREAKQE